MSFDIDSPALIPDEEPLWRRIVLARGVQMVVLALLTGGLAWAWTTSLGGVEVVRERFGVFAAIPLVLLQASITVTPFPDELIGFANSMIYGFAVGALLNWSAWMLGAYIEYAVARRSAYDFDFHPERISEKLPTLMRRFPPEHPAYLILARQIPIGGHIVNSWAGAFKVSLWRFTWTAAIGLLPGSIAIAAAATGLVGWLA